jgi:hypothetical protein
LCVKESAGDQNACHDENLMLVMRGP